MAAGPLPRLCLGSSRSLAVEESIFAPAQVYRESTTHSVFSQRQKFCSVGHALERRAEQNADRPNHADGVTLRNASAQCDYRESLSRPVSLPQAIPESLESAEHAIDVLRP